ncbi:MAG: tRNA lysidine(34) synthetase TilS [Vicinamibacterales bacterium]
MSRLAPGVARFIQRARLVSPGDRIVAALSGGPDSVLLTLVLHELLPSLDASLAAIAHLHHGLRGAEADQDEAFCRALAARLDVEAVVERIDVAGWARARRVSLETAGHQARRDFFTRVLERGLTAVATGHTTDDVAETVLMRLIRGSGTRGLAGIRPRQPGLIRPFLEVTRDDVLRELGRRGEPYRRDSTNDDLAILRNRIRAGLLPWIKREVSPRASIALARTARLAEADDCLLEELLDSKRAALVRREEKGLWSADRELAVQLPLALRGRLVCWAIERVGGSPSLAAVERILERLLERGAQPVFLRGVRVSFTGDEVTFERFDTGRPKRLVQAMEELVLPVPGSVRLTGGRVMEADLVEAVDTLKSSASTDSTVASLDASRVSLPVRVRSRRSGDRLRPLGLGGRKKLQDLLVDRKVPQSERDSVPILVGGDGAIVWVAGHVIAHEVRVTSSTTSVLLLKYRR